MLAGLVNDELKRVYMEVYVAYPTVLNFSCCMPIIQLKLKFINSATRQQMHIFIVTEICAKIMSEPI
jgi:hypothetical protein